MTARRPLPSDLVYLNQDRKIIETFSKRKSMILADVKYFLLPTLASQENGSAKFEVETLPDGREEISCSLCNSFSVVFVAKKV
jgi:hypothetical protein